MPDFVKFGFDLRGEEERHESLLPIRLEPSTPSALYFVGEVPHRLFVQRHSFTAADRSLGYFYGRENFPASPLAMLPKLQRFLDGVLRAGNAAIFDGLANERLLVWA
jgi:hypothetical protein